MINKLRDKKVAKGIWIGLSIIIVPAFLFWGLGSVVRSGKGGPDYAGMAFGKKVSLLDYRQAYLATRTQYLIQLGEEFSKLEKYLNLTERTWDRIILLSQARRRKIRVSDKEVTDMVQKYPFFLQNGKFDYEAYARIIEFYLHTTPREFEEQTRDSLAIAKLYENETANVSITPQEAKDEYRKENEQLSIYYISANTADFANEVNIDDAQIKDYFTKSSVQFKKPESFNLEYLGVEYPADSKEADTKAIDEKVKNLASRLNKEKDLAKIAKEFSLEVKQTGFFTLNEPIPGIGWSPQIIDTISRLNIGDFAPIVQTSKGWYILKLKEKKESYIPTLEEVKERVREKLVQIKSEEMAKAKIKDVYKELQKLSEADLKAADFDKIAKSSGLKSGVTELFKRAGYIPGVGASDKFFDEAQKIGKDKISQIIEAEQGFYIIKLKEIVPIDEEKYKKEEKEFSEALLSRKRGDYFAKFLEDLKKKARLRDSIASIQNQPQ